MFVSFKQLLQYNSLDVRTNKSLSKIKNAYYMEDNYGIYLTS